MVKLIPIYTIRIVYKSGYTHDFDAYSFSMIANKSIEWESVSQTNHPISIGLDEIAAVYQIGVRKVLRWANHD